MEALYTRGGTSSCGEYRRFGWTVRSVYLARAIAGAIRAHEIDDLCAEIRRLYNEIDAPERFWIEVDEYLLQYGIYDASINHNRSDAGILAANR